jgi:hypothetical protein
MTNERREVLELLTELSELCPEMRMGQWLLMFAHSARGTKPESIYDVEDEELLPVMRRFLESRREAATLAAAG